MRFFHHALALLAAALPLLVHAGVSVVDDEGRTVTLARPAGRVISLAPHITELLFAAGGGAHVAGAMNFSDHPAAAAKLPLVGSNSGIDIERVLALKPDLLVAWRSGNTARQLEELSRLGIPVFYSEPRALEDVATSMERLGTLMGTRPAADAAARSYRARIAGLRARYGSRPPVRVFYQVWDRPLYTLSGGHIVSDAIRLCGGVNVFVALPTLAPEVGLEAVLKANPEAVVGSQKFEPDDTGVAMWKRYPGLLAARQGNLFEVQAELLTRASPRIADGAEALCQALETARSRRANHPLKR
jgi:iron complex transport system substrate-binding protein